MPPRVGAAALCALCVAGCRAPGPALPAASRQAAADGRLPLLSVRPTFGWRHYDDALLGAGHGQLRAGLGLEAMPPWSPVGVEGRANLGFFERFGDVLSDPAGSFGAETQLGLTWRPVPLDRGALSLGAGAVLGYVEADELVRRSGFFSTTETRTHSDDYTGLYVRGAYDIPVDEDVSFRLEITRSFDAEAVLGDRLVDLDSWDLAIGMSVRF